MIAHIVALALIAAQSQSAVPPDCQTAEEMGDLAIVGLPAIIDDTVERCRASLPPQSFLLSERGRAFRQQVQAAALAKQAGVIAILRRLEGNGEAAAVSDEQFLQVMADAWIAQIAGPVSPAQCRAIDRMAEVLNPVPAADLGILIASLIALSGRPGERGLCP